MSVTINASIDGTSYSNITKIITGGKTINLTGTSEGSDLPQQVAEIKYGTYTQESDTGSAKDFIHGCASKPDIIILYSDFLTRYTASSKASGTTVVGAVWNNAGGGKMYTTVSADYAGESFSTTNVASTMGSTDDGHITSVDDTKFTVKFVSNRRCGGGLVYSWLAIRLA